MTGTWRVQTTTATRLPGDEAIEVEVGEDGPATEATVVIGKVGRPADHGPGRVEVVASGWRFELEVEEADRASLRRRATRGRADTETHTTSELRAIIPGRVISVSVVAGDRVATGQALLVVEAMKMQNELRSPRDGIVTRLAVGAGQTIDLGDVLVVIGDGADPR